MSQGQRVEPSAYQPPSSRAPVRRRWLRLLPLLLIPVLLVFVGAAWFVFTAEAITVSVKPRPESLAITGGLVVPIGERRLLRPGSYTVVANKPGYQPLQAGIEVGAGDNAFAFELQKLPGRLRVESEPPAAAVTIDGEGAGETPLAGVKLAPGVHQVSLLAKRHLPYSAEIDIEGRDQLQTLTAELTPAWAPVTLSSQPPGATLLVDGEARGKTPVTAEIGAGEHKIALRLDGFQRWENSIAVVAGEPQNLATVQLVAAPGRLEIASKPAGASVRVAGEFRGRTPLTLDLQPGVASEVRISRAGYRDAIKKHKVAAGAAQQWNPALEPILGKIEVRAQPADATLYVDGQPQGAADQVLTLTATAHELAVRKPGHVAFETTVTPKPGLTQTVTPRLLTEAEAKAASIPQTIRSPAGGTLRLIRPGRFTMGAPRREQGARANEVRRSVELTRAFYLGVNEVSNAQFRQFRAKHSSGIVARETLDNDKQPVVRVSWADAVAYCNWLSDQEGLPKAYQGGDLVTPINTGYRLPTEAEWAWAARFAGGRSLKYPWGASMPPTGQAGNYADTTAASLLARHLSEYNDGYPAAAPVGRYAANALGIYDFGGNVTEWVHDRYTGGAAGALATDPTGPASGNAHTLRGSSWRHAGITELRLSYRESASEPRLDVGFRVARYAE